MGYKVRFQDFGSPHYEFDDLKLIADSFNRNWAEELEETHILLVKISIF